MPPTRVLGFSEATYWTLVLRDPRPGLPSRSSLRDYRKEKKPAIAKATARQSSPFTFALSSGWRGSRR
jgi:hypothetical protein